MPKGTDRSLVWDDEEVGRGAERAAEVLQDQVEKDLLAAEQRNQRLLANQRLRIVVSLPFWGAVALLWARVLVDALAGPKVVEERALFALYTDPVLSVFTGYLPVFKLNSFAFVEFGYLIAIAALIGVHRLISTTIRALG